MIGCPPFSEGGVHDNETEVADLDTNVSAETFPGTVAGAPVTVDQIL